MALRVDVFYAPHCRACGKVIPRLKRLAARRGEAIILRELNVLEHLDAAVSAGVRITPTIVVRGRARLSGAIENAAFSDLLDELIDG